jgi:hypothetical protein
MVAALLSLLCVQTCVLLYFVFLQFKKSGGKSFMPRRPSDELADFMADIKRHGYGVVRIDPDTVMRRGPTR